jgi:O-antigen/teichoic acid export membrane protein
MAPNDKRSRSGGRTRAAAIAAGFGYTQFGLSLLSGLVVFPVTVRIVGAHDYGLWLATGEVVGYLLLLDAGIFSVLPWLVAGADGRDDKLQIRRQLSNGLAAGLALGLVLLALAVVVWAVPDAVPLVPPADRDKVRGPLSLLLALTAVGYPFKVFGALTTGLQDMTFNGVAALAQAAMTAALTLGAVWLGFGLWGLAVAVGAPVLVVQAATLPRAWAIAGPLLREWPAPRWSGVRGLMVEGCGAWLGGFGYRLLAASGGVILVASGHPEWATLYAATGKAAQILQQACWIAPDNALVGLAQLHGTGDRAGTRRVVLCTLNLHLLTSGAASIGLLAANPTFVRILLGPGVYAGDYVNVLLVAGLLLGSVAHGAFKAAAVAGLRPLVGSLTLVWGAVHCAAVAVLVQVRGLAGPGEAAIAVGLVAGLVPGVLVLHWVYDLSPSEVVGVIGRWLVRLLPFLAAAGWVGITLGTGQYHLLIGASLAIGIGFAVAVRGLVADVPWPASLRARLARLRLIPRGQSAIPS